MTIIGNRKLQVVRALTIGSFTISTLLQVNAILGGARHIYVAYGPQAHLFALLIMCQAITQLYWILQLFPAELREPDSTLLSENDDNSESEAEPPQTVEPFDIDATHLAYSPLFVLGNILLSMWSYFWLRERYIACQVTLIFNTSIHLYAVYALPSVLHGVPQGKKNLRTHLLSKTSAGIAILYMWKTWGIVDKTTAPSTSELLQTTVFFLLLTLASGPDPTLGLCLICDLVAMILGPHQVPEWHTAFTYMAPAIAIVIAADYYLDARRHIGLAPRISTAERSHQEGSCT